MVDNRLHKRQERLGARYGILILIFLVLILLWGTIRLLSTNKFNGLLRTNILIYSDPVMIFSYTGSGNSVLLAMPSDTYITGLYGYGQYSLDGLWRLGIIDKQQDLLASSLGDATGIPIPYYIGTKADKISANDPITIIKTIFRPANILGYLEGKLVTNIPFTKMINLTTSVNNLAIDKVKVLELSKENVFVKTNLPDNTSVESLDSVNLDQIISGLFEDIRLRKEGLSVAIYNTTGFPALGSRYARILTQLGILVITVDNEPQDLASCTITALETFSSSQTIKVLKALFGCKLLLINEGSTRADLELRLGKNNETIYLPRSR